MEISALNIRITFEKQTTAVDEYRNHLPRREPYFTCWATASGSGNETEEAGTTNPKETIDFTTRWCRALAAVTPEGFSIEADGKLYNILYVNPMGNKRNSLKFHCERVMR